MKPGSSPRARKLAASFIVTLAALPGCGASTTSSGGCEPPECHMNPPPPDPTVTPPATATIATSAAPEATAP